MANGFERYNKKTRREVFLEEMEQVVPWSQLCALVEPHYPKAGNGRPPVGLERMLRIYFLQQWPAGGERSLRVSPSSGERGQPEPRKFLVPPILISHCTENHSVQAVPLCPLVSGSPGIIAESDLDGNIQHEYVFFNGERVARIDQPGSSVHYYLSDHLGSTSMVVSAAGIVEEESDYSPFGTEYVVTGPGVNRYKFTGKERDAESSLDYFGARYYGSSLGRFTSADEPLIDQEPADPQSWNLYSYVRNNPVRQTDPDGHGCVSVDGGSSWKSNSSVPGESCEEIANKEKNGHSQAIVDGSSHKSQSGSSTDPCDALCQAVFHSPEAQRTFGVSSRVADRYMAIPLLTFLSLATPGALEAGGPEITTLGIASGAESETVVIGKLADLKDGVKPGERTLDLPNQGNPKANWAQNSGKLRQAMSEGKPIRDASAGNPSSNTGFLRMERNSA